MAPVIAALQAVPSWTCRVCITAQHRQMLDQILQLFEINPSHDLDVMQPGQDLTDITNRVLSGLRTVLQAEQPDLVLVHGDTSTSMAAALAAFYQHIPVGHVEAGLRTGNLNAPWPEELNRSLIARIASLHFAPTERARQNLLAEGIAESQVHVTGNTVIDALHQAVARLQADATLSAELQRRFPFLDVTRRLILVTAHRRENWGQGLENICAALLQLAHRHDVQMAYPVHPNPAVRETVTQRLGKARNIHLLEPQGYLAFAFLMARSHLILTDSGGIQEEAPSLGKPVLVMRDTTERPEALEAGTVKLVGTRCARITEAALELLDNPAAYQTMAQAINPYGDGQASTRIKNILMAQNPGHRGRPAA